MAFFHAIEARKTSSRAVCCFVAYFQAFVARRTTGLFALLCRRLFLMRPALSFSVTSLTTESTFLLGLFLLPGPAVGFCVTSLTTEPAFLLGLLVWLHWCLSFVRFALSSIVASLATKLARLLGLLRSLHNGRLRTFGRCVVRALAPPAERVCWLCKEPTVILLLE